MADMNEQDPRALANQHRELQKRVEMVQQQMSMVQISLEDCNRAINTIDELSNVSAGSEMMFPIGSGSFVYASISNTDKAVVDIGAGLTVERPIPEAKEILQRRREKLTTALDNMNGSLSQLGQQMQSIESYLARLQQPQGNPGSQ
ncbi:prefoldin subunit alpha [Methanolobus bombayensis]|uniref:prefoldin subunit alpha n=1 Tax=Methanolobus bombayensis TaxID=38023 RepID=UPI001AE73B04|nr:prefoldin subunit alpha [Methanolobus bombayensis]MBP1910231.1 prefoldin alpha subunit [Methanolobus bombayensis]